MDEDQLQRLVSLRRALAAGGTRVIDLFREWDVDLSGEIEKLEFTKAVRTFGGQFSEASQDDLGALFDTFDGDGGGTVSFKEMNRQLRAGADADLSGITVKDKFGKRVKVKLGAGEAGEIALAPTTAAPVSHEMRRKKGSALHGSERLEAREDGPTVQEQLRSILAQNAVRVIDLFRDWDEDQSGTITITEFRRAIGALGYEAPKADTQQLFDSFDLDGGGDISYSELNKALRKQAQIDDALKAGAAGEIVLESKNAMKRTTAERLANALAAQRDPDPWAALRRSSVAPSPRSRPQTSASASGSSRGGGGGAAAAVSPRSFKRAALLFAHHYAASSSAKSQSGGAGQVASDDVMDAVERHEAADRRREALGSRGFGEATRRRHEERRARTPAAPLPPQPSERALLSQLLGTNSEFGTYPPYVKPPGSPYGSMDPPPAKPLPFVDGFEVQPTKALRQPTRRA